VRSPPAAAPRFAWAERERLAVASALLALAALSWAYLWFAPMPMPATHGGTRSFAYLGATFAMWAVMMVAMMTPSVIPAVALFAMAERRGGRRARTVAFVAGYLATWTGFSVFATALQVLLLEAGWVDDMGVATRGTLSAALWFGVAAWQFAPWKRSCLAQCRAPAGFLAANFRPGIAGAFRTGTAHGLYCLGCCWLLMLLLFVGGVMDLRWVAVLTLAVLVEKTASRPGVVRTVIAFAALLAGLDVLVTRWG
jgi:predicted metal-binding membrane protein